MAFVTTNYLNEAVLQMGREEFVRPMVFGAQWKFIRIGVLYSYYSPYQLTAPNQYFSLRHSDFYVGICKDTGYSDPNAVDVVVTTHQQENAPATIVNPYVTMSGQQGSLVWKRSGTETRATGSSTTNYAALFPTRGQLFYDYSYTPSTFFVLMRGATDSTKASADVTRNEFLVNMESERTPTNVGPWLNTSLAYSGSFALSNLCIHWRRSCPTILLSEICVTRFY